ncbi:sulfotransferase family protein [Microbulbifer elongatus]|uniref:sulfotransferase family protein n=1 Tax=Microbulbifer elongatus TaxID=86173 RepID=UPI001CFD22C4|nr:sulfotransferase [Microbulbifer elongatus]
MSSKRPSFLIIGAMKCATTSLYDQLKSQPGIFMPELKEPNFFSDDENYQAGLDWYLNLFASADAEDICGEASTHYTKLPTYPEAVERIASALGKPKLIYVVRHPIERLVSQYIHEWSQGVISAPVDEAISSHPELVDYSRYGMQLAPFEAMFGRENILVVQYEHIKLMPDQVLQEVCDFIGYKAPVAWQREIAPRNISSQRIRRFPMDRFLIDNPLLQFLRRSLVPRKLRDWVKGELTMQQRPKLSKENILMLSKEFDKDMQVLSSYLGAKLTCENYHQVSAARIERPVNETKAIPVGNLGAVS